MVRASTINPGLLPEIDFPGQSAPFTWETLAPRLGVTYTWGDEGQYLVRGGLSRFYDTLGSGQINDTNPTFLGYTFHPWDDSNHNGQVEPEEVIDPMNPIAWNINLDNPGSLETPNRIDPNLKAPVTDELILGFEWSLSPEFTLGVTGTLRENRDLLWRPLLDITRDDYVLDPSQAVSGIDPFTGEGYTITPYVLTAEAAARNTDRATILTNRPDYSRDYKGVEFTATKRLSNRWMLRASLAFNDWTGNVGEDAVQDPNSFQDGRNEDGGQIGIQSSGSGNFANVWYGSSRFTGNLNGLYQLPLDLTLSASVNFREGYAFPQARTVGYADQDGFFNTTALAYDSFDAVRGDDIFLADFKLTKAFQLSGRTRVEIAAELFNAFNRDTILARELELASSRANEPREVISPRVGRFSATVHF